jgi:hypothetical protein
MVEFLPLNAFDCTEQEVKLPDGLVLQRMTDRQMSAAINNLAVPRIPGSSGNSAQVSYRDQWALTATRAYPVVAGHRQTTQAAAFPTLDEPAARLITALRIVCGGSVVATRGMFAQADGEFPIVLGESAMMSRFDGADSDRPTILMSSALDDFYAMYAALTSPAVQADRALQLALRRLVYAGSRTADSDRLIDLIIAAEALFIKRANLPGRTKRDKIASAAAALLGNDPVVNANTDQIAAFLDTTYQARNAEMHGDEQPYAGLHLLDGSPASEPAPVLHDLEKVMRRAVFVVLIKSTRSRP